MNEKEKNLNSDELVTQAHGINFSLKKIFKDLLFKMRNTAENNCQIYILIEPKFIIIWRIIKIV